MMSYDEMMRYLHGEIEKLPEGDDRQFIQDKIKYFETPDIKLLYGKKIYDTTTRSSGEGEASMLAAYALKESIEFIQYQMEQEAMTYTATFSKTQTFDTFYKINGGKFCFNYAGFEVARTTLDSYGNEIPGFRMICLLKASEDGSAIFIEPIYLQVNNAKAKVLSYSAWKFWTYPYLWALEPGHCLNARVLVKLTIFWVEKSQSDRVLIGKSAELVADAIAIDNYELNGTPEWRSALAEYGSVSLLQLPPYSKDTRDDTKTGGRGPFRISVIVTEQDPNNAQQYITAGAEFVNQRKGEWVGIGTALLEEAPR